jgi:hypothetical protein
MKKMDDIMLLMNKVIIDIHGGFDETQFGIFDADEQQQLLNIWRNVVKGDVMRFVNILSPAQKQQVAIWAARRTDYPIEDLIKALKKFVKFLESSNNGPIYPLTSKRIRNTTIFSKKKSIN